ncbi:CBS domain-containing protein [Nocardioides zeae]|uniref:CBS domain-containing protein n=1 Tax=Nocardioides imazamoxiresistens TaxID=3231893 RepID=A0ABU3PWW2_9ACTN|nr:CBS domain-containing protein [Nocardioides zeae]MDT9593250.1 CBS domain-containing protein [Nocardioides zeae]
MSGSVREVMVTVPKVTPADATVAELRAFFANDHVHAALLVDGERLVAVVERADLAGHADTVAGREVGRLDDRVVAVDADAERVRLELAAAGRRRLAVLDADGGLVGLLCLKRSGTGFCDDDGVAARAAERGGC